jgi:hypothetical protein
MNLNITKKQWMIIGVVVAIVAVWYFFLRKKKVESGYTAFQLDPRGVESSFDPALPLLGGNENGYDGLPKFQRPTQPAGQYNWLAENGYTANQLDPKGIESGYRATRRGGIAFGPSRGMVGKVKYESIWNDKPKCGAGAHASKLPDGTWACITNAS